MRKLAMLVIALCCPAIWEQTLSDLAVPAPMPNGSTLVIGFLGGFERWNDDHRSVRRLALKLRNTPDVYAESVSNRRRKIALELILRALDTNKDGKLSAEECARARLILFGQSLGGAAVLATARDLNKLGVPVMLTVQVDSVGIHDDIVSANVASAVNFYQHDPLTIQGREKIRAADPTRTRILANLEKSYVLHPIEDTNGEWARRTFGGSHAKMEKDPAVWNQVEGYIVDAIRRR